MARSWRRTVVCSLVAVGCGVAVYAWPSGLSPEVAALAALEQRVEPAAEPAVAVGPFTAELAALSDRAARALGDPDAALVRAANPDAADDEWRRFVRTDDVPPFLLALGPAAFSAERLFRNIHLNPGDHYLDREQRAALRRLVRVSDDLLQELERIEMRATMVEGEAAIARGQCEWFAGQAMSMDGVSRSAIAEVEAGMRQQGLPMQALAARSFPRIDGRRFVSKHEGGRVAAIPVAALPTVVACRQLRQGLITDLGLRVLAAFPAFGVLPDNVASVMAQAFVQECEESYR